MNFAVTFSIKFSRRDTKRGSKDWQGSREDSERETKGSEQRRRGDGPAMIVSVEHVSRWWRTSGRVNPHGGPVIIPGDRRNGSRDPSTVTPWPRDDPVVMFALVAVRNTGEHRRQKEERRRTKRDKVKWREGEREREGGSGKEQEKQEEAQEERRWAARKGLGSNA